MEKIIKTGLKLKGLNCNGDILKTTSGENNIVEITGNAKSQVVNKVHELIRKSYENIVETAKCFKDNNPSIVVYVVNEKDQIIIALLHDMATKPTALGEEIYGLLNNMESKAS